MTSARRPSFRARQLAGELRRLREQAGLRQEEVAQRLRFSDKKVSRLECGQLPDYTGLCAMLDIYGLTVNEWEPYIELWELATRKGWWRAYGLDDLHYVCMEDEASLVREFQGSFVPGLLQTEDYARATFEASKMPRSSKGIDNDVTVRMRRQQRLVGEDALTLHTIIHEPVLSQGFSPKIMRPQLHRIIRRAELPQVTMQVLPQSAGPHDGWLGSFLVLSFRAAEDPDIGYVEHAFGSVHIDGSSQVRAATLRFEGLAQLALSAEDSLALVKRLAAEP